MTQSKGIGRGGARKGAGRKPSAAKVDWNEVGRAYFSGSKSVGEICESFGVDFGDLLAYGAANHWVRPSTKPHPDEIGDMGSALALQMFSIDGVNKRARCFVAAMVRLEARPQDIAEVLGVSEDSLRAEFPRELGLR